MPDHSPLCSHKPWAPSHIHFLRVLLSLITNFGQDLNEGCFIISCKVLSWLCWWFHDVFNERSLASWLVKSSAVGMIWVDLFPLSNSNYLQISFQDTSYRLKDRRDVTQNISVDFPRKTNHLGFCEMRYLSRPRTSSYSTYLTQKVTEYSQHPMEDSNKQRHLVPQKDHLGSWKSYLLLPSPSLTVGFSLHSS